MSLDQRHKLIFSEIVGAHSPTAIKAKLKGAVQVISKALADNDVGSLKDGAEMLNQAIYRYELLKKAEELAEVIQEYEPTEPA